MADPQRTLSQVAASSVRRFGFLTAAMCGGIVMLVVVEVTVLWRLDVDYSPSAAIRSAGVWEFAADNAGQWAISRTFYMRHAGKQRLQSRVLLHDLRRPGRAVSLGAIGHPRQVAVAARADRWAVACYDGSIYVGSGIHGAAAPRLLARMPRGEDFQIALSPDGETLAAADCRFLYLWRLPGGNLLHRGDHKSGQLTQLSFSGNGCRLLAIGSHGELLLWDMPSGRFCKSYSVDERIGQAVLSRDGRSLVVITTASGLRRRSIDMETGDESTQEFRLARPPHGPAAISPDGSVVAAAVHTGENRFCIQRWNAHTGEPLAELNAGTGHLNGLAFTTGGAIYCWNSAGGILCWTPGSQRQSWRFSAMEWARQEPS